MQNGVPMKNMFCWEIMNCEDGDCIVRRNPDKECWEMVKELEDYRAEFDICSDCIVYVVKTGSLNISEQEIAFLSAQKHNCILSKQ